MCESSNNVITRYLSRINTINDIFDLKAGRHIHLIDYSYTFQIPDLEAIAKTKGR